MAFRSLAGAATELVWCGGSAELRTRQRQRRRRETRRNHAIKAWRSAVGYRSRTCPAHAIRAGFEFRGGCVLGPFAILTLLASRLNAIDSISGLRREVSG